jgi:carbamate kinase
MTRSVVVSLGGNAILPSNRAGTIGEQFLVTQKTLRGVVGLVHDHRVVLTHGNGPIVGNILIRNEAARDQVPPMPLDVCGADSQGGIGYMIQQTLRNLLHEQGLDREVATIVTQIVVDPDDPAFRSPTKPIGPFYDEQQARELERTKGWKLVQDAGRGWRRVVPSPKPRRIVELPTIRSLHDAGHVVVASGGGGIPVVEASDGSLQGVEAVIDKDATAVVLAHALGAEILMTVTAIDRVAIDFGKPTQQWIDSMSLDQARRHLKDGQFPAGSMGPKIEAAIWFLEKGGKGVCVSSPGMIHEALQGRAGTWITKDGTAVTI